MTDQLKILREDPSERERKNRKAIEYVLGRLGERTSSGQCILHLKEGGWIKKIEWRVPENVEDLE